MHPQKFRYFSKIVSFFCLIILVMSPLINAPYVQASGANYERWYHPNYHHDFPHDFASDAWGNYFTTPDFEQNVLPNIDVMSLFMLEVGKNDHDFLSNLIPLLKNHNKKLAIEVTGLFPWTIDTSGNIVYTKIACDQNRVKNSVQSELNVINMIYSHGGTVDYISIDDPISRGIKNSVYANTYSADCGGTVDESISMTLEYIKAVKLAHPEISIGLITNFPNWTYNGVPAYTNSLNFGDYKIALDKLATQAAAENVTIDFIHADNPYDYAIGAHGGPNSSIIQSNDWMKRILDLEKQANSHGWKFGLIYNTERGGQSTGSDQQYYDDTINFIKAYKAKGGKPDHVVIESWYPRPLTMLPAALQYSMSYTALQAFALYSTFTFTPTNCSADLNDDHLINLTDYGILVQSFLKSPMPNRRTDINDDGKTNLQDYSLLARSFLKSCP